MGKTIGLIEEVQRNYLALKAIYRTRFPDNRGIQEARDYAELVISLRSSIYLSNEELVRGISKELRNLYGN